MVTKRYSAGIQRANELMEMAAALRQLSILSDAARRRRHATDRHARRPRRRLSLDTRAISPFCIRR
jgi:hypothetical protein